MEFKKIDWDGLCSGSGPSALGRRPPSSSTITKTTTPEGSPDVVIVSEAEAQLSHASRKLLQLLVTHSTTMGLIRASIISTSTLGNWANKLQPIRAWAENTFPSGSRDVSNLFYFESNALKPSHWFLRRFTPTNEEEEKKMSEKLESLGSSMDDWKQRVELETSQFEALDAKNNLPQPGRRSSIMPSPAKPNDQTGPLLTNNWRNPPSSLPPPATSQPHLGGPSTSMALPTSSFARQRSNFFPESQGRQAELLAARPGHNRSTASDAMDLMARMEAFRRPSSQATGTLPPTNLAARPSSNTRPPAFPLPSSTLLPSNASLPSTAPLPSNPNAPLASVAEPHSTLSSPTYSPQASVSESDSEIDDAWERSPDLKGKKKAQGKKRGGKRAASKNASPPSPPLPFDTNVGARATSSGRAVKGRTKLDL